MAVSDLDILRAIHDVGNTATRAQIWPTIRREAVKSGSMWRLRAERMQENGLMAVEFSEGVPSKFTLLPAGMELISDSGHQCDPQFCQPPEDCPVPGS